MGAHKFFDGIPSPKAEWGSYSNINSFLKIWDQVKADGRWEQHDWIVKVDADAVFLPDRLKTHIRTQLKTPQGSKVYLRNIKFAFEFMGALEIMTREALALYFEKGHTCRQSSDGTE